MPRWHMHSPSRSGLSNLLFHVTYLVHGMIYALYLYLHRLTFSPCPGMAVSRPQTRRLQVDEGDQALLSGY